MKLYVIVNDSDLTQEMLNETGHFNTTFLRWNQNKSIVQAKKWILCVCGSVVPPSLISYYPYTHNEMVEILKDSEWQDIEVSE
jgi:uncharacterized membrane protein YbaN (DUF454 family)